MIPSHLKVTLIIISINAFIIGLALLLNYFSFHVTLQFLFIFLTGSVILSTISILMNKIEENKRLKFTPRYGSLKTWGKYGSEPLYKRFFDTMDHMKF